MATVPPSRPRPSRLASSLGALAVLAVLASGCAAEPSGTPIAAAASTATGPSSSGLAPFADVDATEVTVVADVSIPGSGSAVDVCLPPGTGAEGTVRPAMLAVHGGSWARGDRAHEAWRAVCEWLAIEGFVGVSVGYRLAPEFPFPAGVDDVAAALASTQDPHFAARFGIDSARVALFGGSAGGNLAALVGLRDGLSGAGAVSAVVSLSAPLDLTADAAASPEFERPTLDYLGCESLAACPAAQAASPQHAISSHAPAFLVVHGREEQLIPFGQAEAFVSALQRAGAEVEFLVREDSLHSLELVDRAVADRALAFLHSHLAAVESAVALGIDAP